MIILLSEIWDNYGTSAVYRGALQTAHAQMANAVTIVPTLMLQLTPQLQRHSGNSSFVTLKRQTKRSIYYTSLGEKLAKSEV